MATLVKDDATLEKKRQLCASALFAMLGKFKGGDLNNSRCFSTLMALQVLLNTKQG